MPVIRLLSVLLALVVASLSVFGCRSLLPPVQTERSELGSAAADGALYGVADDVLGAVEAVKSAGAVRVMSSRAVRLPTRALEPITSFDYRFPAGCGGQSFRVIESGDTQILELRHALGDGSEVRIRDYVAGASPFIRPGLWNANDHTSDDIDMMVSQFVETSASIVPAVYSKGLVTGMPETTQRELGIAYRDALRQAAGCVHR